MNYIPQEGLDTAPFSHLCINSPVKKKAINYHKLPIWCSIGGVYVCAQVIHAMVTGYNLSRKQSSQHRVEKKPPNNYNYNKKASSM